MMDNRGFNPYVVPSPRQSMWVPFAGSKRKAEGELQGSSPAKLCAIERPGIRGEFQDEPMVDGEMTPETNHLNDRLRLPISEELSDKSPVLMTLPSSFTHSSGDCAGVHLTTKYDDAIRDVGDDLNPHEHDNFVENDINNLNKTPKLYFFEALREVLSNPQCVDSILPRKLVKDTLEIQRESAMAMVLWKPLPHNKTNFELNSTNNSSNDDGLQQEKDQIAQESIVQINAESTTAANTTDILNSSSMDIDEINP